MKPVECNSKATPIPCKFYDVNTGTVEPLRPKLNRWKVGNRNYVGLIDEKNLGVALFTPETARKLSMALEAVLAEMAAAAK